MNLAGKERLVKLSSAVEVFSWNPWTEEGLLWLKKSAEEGCGCVGIGMDQEQQAVSGSSAWMKMVAAVSVLGVLEQENAAKSKTAAGNRW